MSNSLSTEMADKMAPIRQRYFEILRQRMVIVEKAVALIPKQAFADAADRAELQSEAHKLAGTGTTYGFPNISDRARLLEDALMANPDSGPDNLLELANQLLTVCHEALSTATATVTHVAPLPVAVDKAVVQANQLPVLLVLDDDPSILQLMRETFQNDARVVTGVNSTEALVLIQNEKPDLVLLDNLMPGGVSGLSLLEGLQSSPQLKNIPVIMISGSEKPEEVMRGLMAGAVDYITKPFDIFEMSAKVRKRLWRLQCQILIADDDESIRDLVRHKLKSAGCSTVCVSDGEQAWGILQNQPIALAVLDLMMPGFDGMALLRMMKADARFEDIPVVFLTARHMSADVLAGLNTGAADYITKPFNSDELVMRCTRLLPPLPKKRP